MRHTILTLALLAMPAFAQGGKFEAACGADAAKLCPGMGPHKGLHKCMRAHASEVSQPCADFMATMKKHGEPPPAPAPAP